MFSTVLVIYVHAFEHRQEVVVDIRVAVDQADPPKIQGFTDMEAATTLVDMNNSRK
jgi:hypothetical protein